MEWMLLPLRRYADFTGRSQRQEYWMFYLFTTLLYVAAIILLATFGGLPQSRGKPGLDEPPMVFSIGLLLIILLYLALYIPTLAVKVRRFHDQDLSGFLVLLGFIPYLGWLVTFILMCMDGTAGPNRFGPDPKGRGGARHADIFA
jgi:uncharacterized membrane protein YhaH (DUF805 family)